MSVKKKSIPVPCVGKWYVLIIISNYILLATTVWFCNNHDTHTLYVVSVQGHNYYKPAHGNTLRHRTTENRFINELS